MTGLPARSGIRTDKRGSAEKGLLSIEPERLLHYLNEMEKRIDSVQTENINQALLPADFEQYKARLSLWREERIELFRASVLTGQTALKT
jgi:hypothetical protein